MKKLFLLLFILTIPLTSFAQSHLSINSEEARRVAERFVSCSGYTEKRLQPKECGEHKIDCNDNIFPCKFLEKKAFGFFQGRRNGKSGWTIVFRRRGDPRNKTTGAVITMNLDGTDVKIEEAKVFLKFVEKKY